MTLPEPLNGALLVVAREPSAALGIYGTPNVKARADELLRAIGKAWADLTIPRAARSPLAEAVAIMAVAARPDDNTGADVLAYGREQLRTGALEDEVAGLRGRIGWDAADQSIARMLEVATALWTALEDQPIPDESRRLFTIAATLVADAGSPAGDDYPGGLQ